jgi:hypothetical protein
MMQMLTAMEQKDNVIISNQLQIAKKDKIIIELNEYIIALDIVHLPILEDPKDKIIQDLNARIVLLELKLSNIEKINVEHIIEQTIMHSNLDEELIEQVDTICKQVVTQLFHESTPEPEPDELNVIHAVYKNIGMDNTLEITFFAGDKIIKRPFLYENYKYDENKDQEHSILITAKAEVEKWYMAHGKQLMEKYNLCCKRDIQVFTRNGNPPREYSTESPYEKPLNFEFIESIKEPRVRKPLKVIFH